MLDEAWWIAAGYNAGPAVGFAPCRGSGRPAITWRISVKRIWRVHVLHVLWATCLCLKRVVLLQVREVTRDLITARLLYAIHVCVAQERAQKKGLVP